MITKASELSKAPENAKADREKFPICFQISVEKF